MESEDDGPTMTLKEPIDLNLLKEGADTEFEVDEKQFDETNQETDDGHFNQQDIYKYLNPEMGKEEEDSDDEEEETSDSATPFEKLAKRMENVTEDGLIKKMMLKQGYGATVSGDVWVTIHYNEYLEYSDEPLDSSRLRNEPQKFLLGAGYVVQGLDLAVATMKKGELSRFLIGHDYLYGELGCPPRIPGGVTLMFEVELLSTVDVAGVGEFYQLTREERRNAGLEVVKKIAVREKEDGKSAFKRQDYRMALRSYNKGIQALEECRVKDEAEDNERQKLLRQMLTNAAICHMKLSQHGRVITHCKMILEIDPQHVQAMYLRGKALRCCSEWDGARRWLMKALSQNPNERDIQKELKLLDQKLEQFKSLEKVRCQQMLQLDKSPEAKESSTKTEPAISQGYEESISDILQGFIDDAELVEMPFPSLSLTDHEITSLITKAKKMNLSVEYRGEGDNSHIRFVKKNRPKP